MKQAYIKPLTKVTKIILDTNVCQYSGQLNSADFSFEAEEAKIDYGYDENESSWGNLWAE